MMGDRVNYIAANLSEQISAPCGLVKVVLPRLAGARLRELHLDCGR